MPPADSILARVRRTGAMAVVFSEDRTRVLLLRREVFILWDLPGGGVEKGETPRDAAVREAREETGYDVAIMRPVGRYLCQSIYTSGDQLTHAFEARITGGTPKRFGLEVSALRWFDVSALPRGLERLHREIIADALGGGPERGVRRIDFARWKLYPVRVVFFIVALGNRGARFVLRLMRRRATFAPKK